MDYFKGVEVEMTSNGRVLPLYDDPDTPDHQRRYRQRYVEAVTGANFAIKVTLNQHFEFGESGIAQVGLVFDGDPVLTFVAIRKTAWLVLRTFSFTFSSFATFCPVSSTWKQRYFLFGSLDISNDPLRTLRE